MYIVCTIRKVLVDWEILWIYFARLSHMSEQFLGIYYWVFISSLCHNVKVQLLAETEVLS